MFFVYSFIFSERRFGVIPFLLYPTIPTFVEFAFKYRLTAYRARYGVFWLFTGRAWCRFTSMPVGLVLHSLYCHTRGIAEAVAGAVWLVVVIICARDGTLRPCARLVVRRSVAEGSHQFSLLPNSARITSILPQDGHPSFLGNTFARHEAQ